jgi:hypothetical protein
MGRDARTTRRMTSWCRPRHVPERLASVVLVISCALGAAVATAPPAAAAGDPGLDARIVAPAPASADWRTAPASEVAAIVSRITKLDDDGLPQPGSHVTVAAELWISPASDALVGVTLVQWPGAVDNLDRVVATGVRQECVATTGNNPSTTGSLDTVPGSVTASCSGSGVSGMIVAARRGSVSELVETYSLGPTGVPMPAAQLDAMATTQFQRLPAVASSDAPVVATAVVVVVAASFLAVVVRRSRRRGRTVTVAPAGLGPSLWPAPSAYGMPPAATYPSPSAQQPVSQVPAGQTAPPGPAIGEALAPLGGAPGWHPVGGDPLHLHYWDGTRWSSTVRWDGTEWREDGSAPPS